MVTSFTFIVQSPTLLNKFLFAPDLRIIPDQHYFSTDAVINHHYIHPVFLSAIILKQFKETLYTYSRPLLTCEWIGQHIVKRMMLQVKDCQKFTALLLLCYSPAFSEQFERLNKGWVTWVLVEDVSGKAVKRHLLTCHWSIKPESRARVGNPDTIACHPKNH